MAQAPVMSCCRYRHVVIDGKAGKHTDAHGLFNVDAAAYPAGNHDLTDVVHGELKELSMERIAENTAPSPG
jgi:hypothetical protein